jgi:uncharacterized membrane protein
MLDSPQVQFMKSCESTCEQTRDNEFCVRYCDCVLGDLEADGTLDGLLSMSLSREENARVTGIAHQCAAKIDAEGVKQ